ncbi:hypothetical protein LGZ98_23475, partial [Photorhabdus kayaii]|nr:hypothetical protein [Photorhabdus kayaii]
RVTAAVMPGQRSAPSPEADTAAGRLRGPGKRVIRTPASSQPSRSAQPHTENGRSVPPRCPRPANPPAADPRRPCARP